MKTKKPHNGRGKSSFQNRNRGETPVRGTKSNDRNKAPQGKSPHKKRDKDQNRSNEQGRGKDHTSRKAHGHKPRQDNADAYSAHSHRPRIRIGLYGTHAVAEALVNPERAIHHIYATEQTEEEIVRMVEHAMSQGRDLPAIELLEKETMDRALPKGSVHQGIALDCDPLQESFLPDIINRANAKETAGEKSVVIVLDQVTDPHNLGAIIRSACAFGADGIIVQSRHAPELSPLIAKIASGAAEHTPVIYETNLARAIESLQEHGFFAVAMDERGENSIAEAPKYAKTILVMGAEGPGLRPLVRNKCDLLVKLPTSGPLSSLNVSNATAVALYAIMN